MRRSDWLLVVGVTFGVAAIIGGAISVASILPSQSVGVGTILSGVATLVLAALTAVIVVLNARVLRATRDAAEATRDAAKATKEEADATLEEAKATREQADATKEQAELAAESIRQIQLSRELDWRPFLVRMDVGSRTSGGRAIRDITVQNIGRGPALNALYLKEEHTQLSRLFLRTGPMNLAPGPAVQVPAEQQAGTAPPELFPEAEFPPERQRELLVCHDQFGNWYRFLPGFPVPRVWKEEYDDRGTMISEEPGWVEGVRRILWTGKAAPVPEPEPGYAFQKSISMQGNPTYCETTVVFEAVPPSDLKPTDSMRDLVERWMFSLEPRAKSESLDIAWWMFRKEGSVWIDWDGRLDPGPMVAVREILKLHHRPAAGGPGLQPEADLPLLPIVDYWKKLIREGASVMAQLGAGRIRLGITLITSGIYDQPRLVGLDFTGLSSPSKRLEVPPHQIRNWSYSVKPFRCDTWPGAELEKALRQLLRIFGYREVDELMMELHIQSPDSDENLRG